LSCAAILAFGPGNWDASTALPTDDRLWLVDATGAYSVRAICLGGGMMKSAKVDVLNHDADNGGMMPTADAVNKKLLDWMKESTVSGKERRPYCDMTAKEGLVKLLDVLSGRMLSDNASKDDDIAGQAVLERGTRLELGIVGPTRVSRKRVSEIWGKGRSSHALD